MTPALHRLAALIASFAPGRAERLVGLVATSTCQDLAAYAAELARRPRRERLAALAAAFSEPEACACGVSTSGHPVWQRLTREGRAQGPGPRHGSTRRTSVRIANGTRPLDPAIVEVGPAAEAGTAREATTPRRWHCRFPCPR